MGSYDDDLTQDQVKWLRERAEERLNIWKRHAASVRTLTRRLPIIFRWALTAPFDEPPPRNSIDERLAKLRRKSTQPR